MNRLNKIERLKDSLYEQDYKVIKCAEAQLTDEEMPYNVVELVAARNDIRNEINTIEGMTDEEYYEAYPEEREVETEEPIEEQLEIDDYEYT